MAVIGIDLGTTYSAASRCVNGQPEIILLDGHPTLPSVVSLLKGGKVVVGWTAKRNQASAPHNTIIEVKRKMGTPAEVSLGEKKMSPQEVSALILMRIKELAEEQLGEQITGVVISCPAYFKDPARAATQQAGELAGLKVLRIINEPTAAAYAYAVREGLQQAAGAAPVGGQPPAPAGQAAAPSAAKPPEDKERLFLVYDLGGGTFDVTVIKMAAGLLEVIGTGGDPQLGGGNFDDLIVEWMLAEIEKDNPGFLASLNDEMRPALKLRLKIFAEEGKIRLCDLPGENASFQFQIMSVALYQGRPIIFNKTLTRPMFEDMIRGLLKNSMKWIDEALKVPKEKNYIEKDLTAVLLVGGSTRIPLVRQMLDDRFRESGTQVWGQEKGINPDEIVAMGASIVAAERDPNADEAATTTKMIDVTGHTLSVAVWDDRMQRKVLAPIIAKETEIPCSHVHRFVSQGRGQHTCRVEVYQGEGTEISPDKVQGIGAFDIEIAPIEAPTPLQIGLTLDDNGILLGHAVDELSGLKVQCRLDYNDKSRMSAEELSLRKARLQKQLQQVIAQTANPLDAQPARSTVRQTQPVTGQAMDGQAAGMGATGGAGQFNNAAGAPADPTTLMNSIMRALYQRAINGFNRVPADRQNALIQIVTAIDAAARTGNAQQVNGYLSQLAQLMDGVQ